MCHYIGWDLVICIDNLDKDESACTREQCFTNTFKIMSSGFIVKITNSETVCKWHDLFRIQEQFPLLKKEKYQIPYFVQSSSDISEAIISYDCKNLDTISQQMMHLYIHDTVILQILEEMEPEF